MEHTQEPWFRFGGDSGPPCIGGPFAPGPDDDPGQTTAGVAHFGMRLRTNEEAAANIRRVVACVNVLAGISTEALEEIVNGTAGRKPSARLLSLSFQAEEAGRYLHCAGD